MSVIGVIRRCALLLTVGGLLAACGPSGASAPATAPATVSQTAAPIPLAQSTIGARGTASATPIIADTTRTATRAASIPSATPGTADAGCDNAAMAALVAHFLDAYNAGVQGRLLAFFPVRDAARGIGFRGEETYFKRYWDVRKPTLRDEDGFAAYARTNLPPYWAQRHVQHERLQLLGVDSGGAGRFDLVGIGFMLIRQADDLPEHIVVGKAEIDCGQGTFTVWSMGPQEQPAATPTRL